MYNSVDMDLLSSSIANNNAVIFVGAGFSKNAVPTNEYIKTKFLDWGEFILLLGKKIWPEFKDEGKLKEKCTDFLYVVQLFKDRFGEDEFYKMFKIAIPTNDYIPSSIHKGIFEIPWTDVITTNMDNLIEKSFDDLSLPYDLIIDDEQVSINSSPYPKIIKMHGTFDRPNTIIFSEEDYRLYEKNHPLMVVKVKQIFAERTVFFIGFSLTDPNFKKIFLWVNDILKKYQKRAYAFVPNADHNEIEYWRDRNIIIFSSNENKSDYTQKLNSFIKQLEECVNRYNIRSFQDTKKYIFENINYEAEINNQINDLNFYLKNNRNNDVMKVAGLIINNIYKYLKKSESLGMYNDYKTDILNELLLNVRTIDESIFSLPNVIFEEFNTLCKNSEISYKIIEILEKYIEAYQVTKIRVKERTVDIHKYIPMKQYDIYELFRNSDKINNKTKQFLIYSKIKELYYKERLYEETLKFIEQNIPYVDNPYYQDEIRYIELLCFKHSCDYNKILQFLKEDSFRQENSMNYLRLGYLNYLINDVAYMKKNYEKALNSNEKNVSNCLTSIYNLRLLSISNIYNSNNEYKEFLHNKEEQLRHRISFSSKKVTIFDIKDSMIKLEGEIIQLLVKNEGKHDLFEIIERFKEFVRIAEYNGVPDIFVSKNSYFEILFNKLKMELPTKIYLDSFFSFGVNINGTNFSDKIIEYGKLNEYIFNVLNNKIEKSIDFLTYRKVEPNFEGLSFSVRVLDESIKYLLEVISVIDEEKLIALANNMFSAFNLNIRQINNKIKENAVQVISKVINTISPEKAVTLFEKYIGFIVENNLDWYLVTDEIHFIGWNKNTLEKFNYSLLIELLRKLETVTVHRIDQYFYLIVNINIINAIPDEYRGDLLKILIRLQKYNTSYPYLLLINDLEEDKLQLQNIIDNIYESFIKYTKDDVENTSVYHMNTGEHYYTFGDMIEFLDEKKQNIILELGNKQIQKADGFMKTDIFPFTSNESLKEAVQYFIIKYSMKNNNFIALKEYVEKHTIRFTHNSLELLRSLFESQPQLVNSIIKAFEIKLKYNEKEDKITTLRNLKVFYKHSTKIMNEELIIIELIKKHLYEVDKDILGWIFDILATIISNNNEWARDNISDIVDVITINSERLLIDSERFLISFSYILCSLFPLCDGDRRGIIEKLIIYLRDIKSKLISRELANVKLS